MVDWLMHILAKPKILLPVWTNTELYTLVQMKDRRRQWCLFYILAEPCLVRELTFIHQEQVAALAVSIPETNLAGNADLQ